MLLQCPCSGNNGLNPFILLAIVAGAWVLFNWVKTQIKSKGVSVMNKAVKIVIVIALIAVVGLVFALRQKDREAASEPADAVISSADTAMGDAAAALEDASKADKPAGLPRLIDLGAGKCIPCKMMKPLLDELKENYKNSFQVIFIDVWENPGEAKKYGIRLIPTQIFYDAGGKELFRHEGFYSKEDILGKWKELGFDFDKKR
jgi:thioredoxin 1